MLNVIWTKQPEADSVDNLMLKSHELSIVPTHPDYPKKAMHVFTTNAEAATWNTEILSCLEGELYTYLADDCKNDQLANIANVVFSDNPKETQNLLRVLNVKIGACMMLTNNLDVADGLTNGAMGTVTKIITNNKAHEHKKI